MASIREKWWLHAGVLGALLGGLLLAWVALGAHEVEHAALLNDLKRAKAAATHETPLQASRRFGGLAAEIEHRLDGGGLDERNIPTARFLAALFRYWQAERELDHHAVTSDSNSHGQARAYERLLSALGNAALTPSTESLGQGHAAALRQALGEELPSREQLSQRLESLHWRLAARCLRESDHLAAWQYLRLLHSPLSIRTEQGEELWVLPSLGARAAESLQAFMQSLAQSAAGGPTLGLTEQQTNCASTLDRFASLCRMAAGSARPAGAELDRKSEELAKRQSTLEADIAALSRPALTAAQEREHLSRYYPDSASLEAALKDTAQRRLDRLAERRLALKVEVERYKAAQEALAAFLQFPARLLNEVVNAPRPREALRQSITAALAGRRPWLLPLVGAARQPLPDAAQLAQLAQNALAADLYLCAAQCARLAGRKDESPPLLRELQSHFETWADLVQFEPPATNADSPNAHLGLSLLTAAKAQNHVLGDSAEAARVQLAWLRRMEAALLTGSSEHTALALDEALTVLHTLSGPRRPDASQMDEQGRPELSQLEAHYGALRDAALRMLTKDANSDQPEMRDLGALGLAQLLLADAGYHYDFLFWQDPESLCAFVRPGESTQEARARWLEGPPREIRRQVAEILARLEQRTRFSEHPRLYIETRLLKGRLRELSPAPSASSGLLGDWAGALREIYLPLCQGSELRSLDPSEQGALDSLSAFAARYLQRLDRVLALAPQPDALQAARWTAAEACRRVLAELGNVTDHVAMLDQLAALRVLPPAAHRRAYELLAHVAGLEQHLAQVARAARQTEEERTYAGGARRHYRLAASRLMDDLKQLPPGASEAALMCALGLCFEQGGEPLLAVAALRRYFAARDALDRAEGKGNHFEAANAMARSFETLENFSDAGDGCDFGGAVAAWRWSVMQARRVIEQSGKMPPHSLEAFIGLARSRRQLALVRQDATQLCLAIEELEDHILLARIFKVPPRDLDQTSAWRDAQFERGLCALELARLERAEDGFVPHRARRWLDLARRSFDDVVQRFHEEESDTVLRAQLELARAEWMDGVYVPSPLSDASLEPLKRAAARMQALTAQLADLRTRSDTEQVPFEHEALERDALCLKGDVLELLGRRLESIAAAPLGQPSDWLEARKRLEDALVAYERLERLYGLSYLCAWGLAQRIEILRLLGVRAAVDRQRAQELLDGAERTLERIPQSQWAQAPRSMGKTYWEQWFRWYRQSRALER